MNVTKTFFAVFAVTNSGFELCDVDDMDGAVPGFLTLEEAEARAKRSTEFWNEKGKNFKYEGRQVSPGTRVFFEGEIEIAD